MLIVNKGRRNTGRGTDRVCEQTYKALLSLGFDVRLNEYTGSYIKSILAEWVGFGVLFTGREMTISANGRVSPLKVLLRERFSIIVLDWMNYIASPMDLMCSPRQLISRLHHTAMSRLSLRYSDCVYTISNKVKRETEEKLGRWGSKKPVFLLQPYGSFTIEKCGEIQKEVDNENWAIWTTGMTKNKAYARGKPFLEDLGLDIVYRVVGVRKNNNGSRRFYYRERRYNEDEMVCLYRYSRIAFCLSQDEGFGLPFLDAILFGIPVVSTNIATHREIAEYVGNITSEVGAEKPEIWWLENSEVLSSSKNLREWCQERIENREIGHEERVRRYIQLNAILKDRFKKQLQEGLSIE